MNGTWLRLGEGQFCPDDDESLVLLLRGLYEIHFVNQIVS
jgi:hypothetical protein